MAYTGETPTFDGNVYPNNGVGFDLNGNSYIRISGIQFNLGVALDRVRNGSHDNEIDHNTFYGPMTMLVTGDSNQNWVTNNWIHHNNFLTSGSGCTDGGSDTIDIGQAQGSYGNSADNDNNNSIEYNYFDHAMHTNLDNYGLYTAIRYNVFHNEPWSTPPCTANPYLPYYSTGTAAWSSNATYQTGYTVTSGGNTYVSLQDSNTNHAVANTSWWTNIGNQPEPDLSSLRGNYGHRNFQITEDYNRTFTRVLVEGNRSGYAGVNQSNDGADDFSLAAPQNIVRYNFFYASMNPGILFKYQWSSGLDAGGHGGTYNRVYNNTFYRNGWGYPLGLATGCDVNGSSCPWPESAISLYESGAGQGNVLKNNIFYLSAGYTKYGSDVLDKGSPSNGWGEVASATNNWCTGPQKGGDLDATGHHGCAASGDPKFNNPDLSNFDSKILPDLSLQSSSGAIDGGTYLTTATNSGTSSTKLTVTDAAYFQDGTIGSDLARASTGLGGTMQADWIAIGSVTNTVQIASVSYGAYNAPAGSITLASRTTWKSGDHIWLYKKSDGAIVLSGAAPDYGASEYGGSTQGPQPPTDLRATVQ